MTTCVMWTVWRFPRRIFHSQNHLIRPGTWLLKSLTGYTWETTKTKSAKPFIIQMARFHPNLILCPVNKLLYGPVGWKRLSVPWQDFTSSFSFIALWNEETNTLNYVMCGIRHRFYPRCLSLRQCYDSKGKFTSNEDQYVCNWWFYSLLLPVFG